MPIYVYECQHCQAVAEEFQSFNDAPLVKCKTCHRNGLQRVPQVPYLSVKLGTSDLKTVGHLAARNTELYGKKIEEERLKEEEKREEERMKTPLFGGKFKRAKKQKAERPWWRDTDKIDKSLAKMTPKQMKKYILEGKK